MNVVSAMVGGIKGTSVAAVSGTVGISGPPLTEEGFMIRGMFSNGVLGNDPLISIQWILLLIAMCMILPNSQEIFSRYKPGIETYSEPDRLSCFGLMFQWRPTFTWTVVIYSLFMLDILSLILTGNSEFLYFQF